MGFRFVRAWGLGPAVMFGGLGLKTKIKDLTVGV